MSDDLHDVVKLLLKRMESHPEEFGTGPTNRWGWMLNDVLADCSIEEAEAIKKGLRPIRLQEIHETVMDELLNGDERRRKEQEEQDYRRQVMMQRAQNTTLQGVNPTHVWTDNYSNVGIGNITPSHSQVTNAPTRYPTSTDMERSGIMDAVRNIMK